MVAGGELFARYYLGLGTPPLSVTDSKIEYMFKPNQDLHRFHNHFVINEYGMRTNSFERRPAPNELRVMVFGDSVLNGGNLTDQAKLATTLIQDRLAAANRRRVLVGNISAGSWGPGNWLGYSEKYGFFDADLVILVVSSHDEADNPTFQPLNPYTHPTEMPVSALIEGIMRYLPRYLQFPFSSNGAKGDEASSDPEGIVASKSAKGLEDLRNFLVAAKQVSQFVMVLQHWTKEEISSGQPASGHGHIQEVCESVGVSTVQLMPSFKEALERGNDPYRDKIHPNEEGQRLIAEAILENLPEQIIRARH